MATQTTVQISVDDIQLSQWTDSQALTADGPALEQGEVPSDNVLVQELRPVDGGLAAWSVLATAFVFEAILWGSCAPIPRFRRLLTPNNF